VELTQLLRIGPMLSIHSDVSDQSLDELRALGTREFVFTPNLMEDPINLLGVA
jgi:hypothetical protein